MRTTQSLAACVTCIYHSPPPSLPFLALFPTLSKNSRPYPPIHLCMPLPSTVKHNLFEEIIHLFTQNYRLLNTTGKLPNHVCVTLVLRAVGVSIILSFSFFLLWPKFCLAVLRESCENRNRGVGGGLLLLAACTDGPLLLVQQARKSMSQPAE